MVERLLDENSDNISAEQRDRALANLQQDLDSARQSEALCAGIGDAQLQDVVPLTLRAAQLGDDAAANCYVGGALMQTNGVLDHPEWLTQYKQNALDLANAAIERGDWTMAGQMQFAYAQYFRTSLLSQLVGDHPELNYQYLKLRRLGANEEDAAFLDQELKVASKNLPADAITDGDVRAQDMYQRYFSSTPENHVVHNVNTCQIGDD